MVWSHFLAPAFPQVTSLARGAGTDGSCGTGRACQLSGTQVWLLLLAALWKPDLQEPASEKRKGTLPTSPLLACINWQIEGHKKSGSKRFFCVMLKLIRYQNFVTVNRQHIVTAIIMQTWHTDPSIKQFENKAPVIHALFVIQISTLSQKATAHMSFIRVKYGNRQEKIQDSSPLGVNITSVAQWFSSYWCLFSNPWLYRLEGSHCGLYLSVSDRSDDINNNQLPSMK